MAKIPLTSRDNKPLKFEYNKLMKLKGGQHVVKVVGFVTLGKVNGSDNRNEEFRGILLE